MTKEEVIKLFIVGCDSPLNAVPRKVAVETQFKRNTWEVYCDLIGLIRIENCDIPKIIFYPTWKFALINNGCASEVIFELSLNDFKVLEKCFFGKFQPDNLYLEKIGAIMRNPYLIQRAKFKDNDNGKGVDKILSFDYMGSAEFEYGSLPASLKRIRENIDGYVKFDYRFKMDSSRIVTVFCKDQHKNLIGEVLETISEDKIRLKERCDLRKWVYSGECQKSNDFWWDIDQDWMVWKCNPDFDEKFQREMYVVKAIEQPILQKLLNRIKQFWINLVGC